MARIGNYQKTKFITRTITSNEITSGLVRIPILAVVRPSGTGLDYLFQVRTAANVDKTNGITSNYIKPSGLLAISSGSFATGDKLTVLCTFSN
jgi:hypothetical protein